MASQRPSITLVVVRKIAWSGGLTDELNARKCMMERLRYVINWDNHKANQERKLRRVGWTRNRIKIMKMALRCLESYMN